MLSLTAALPAGATTPAAAPPSADKAADPSQLGGDLRRTRFVVGLDREVQYQVFSLANPTNRVIVELPDVKLQLPQLPAGQSVGLVRSFRGGLTAPGKTRIIIDVTAPVVVERAVIETPKGAQSARLVLEIVPVAGLTAPSEATPPGGQQKSDARRKVMTADAFRLGAGAVQPPLPKPAVRPDPKATAGFKPVIVIDPGHGGHDSGAVRHGTVEKDVVLAFSLMLRDKLNATGRYRVLMTRDTDRFIHLDDRRAFADQHQAQLFIAIHADSAPGGSQARGATIYSLREGVAEELRRSAKGERSADLMTSKELEAVRKAPDADAGAVQGILRDLLRREVDATKDRTKLFTGSVVEFLGSSTNLMDNPERTAAFRVLKTAKYPSVLIELAFVTNKQDAAQLKSEDWRRRVSGSIVTAVDNYFSHELSRLPIH